MTNEEINKRIEELKKELEELRKEKRKNERFDFNYARKYLREKLNEVERFYKDNHKMYDNSNRVFCALYRKYRTKAKNINDFIKMVDSFVHDEKDKVNKKVKKELNNKMQNEYFKTEKEEFDGIIKDLIDDLYESYRMESVVLFMTEMYYDKIHLTKDRIYSDKVNKKYNAVFERLRKKAVNLATNYRTNSVADINDEELSKAKVILSNLIKNYYRRLVSHL